MPDATELAALADIKTYLGLGDTSQDAVLTLIKNSVEQKVKTLTGRDLIVTSYTEFYDGDGGSALRLNQRPITALTSIYSDPARIFSDATLIPSSDYVADAESLRLGFVELLTYRFLKGIKSTKVVYSAGYSTIPYDLSDAVRMIVCKQFKIIDKKLFAEQAQQIGDLQITLSPDKWPKDAMETIMNYRRMSF